MAENLDTPSFGNFSIENTMEMGSGSAELLNDLLAPETSTGNPDDIQEIVKEVEDPAPAPKKAPAAKTIGDTVAEAKAPEEDASATLAKFLTGDDDEEEEEEAPAPKAKPAKAPVAETKQEETEDEEEPVVSRFTALSNDLFKLGVFTKDEDDEDLDISTPEAFLEKFQAEKEKEL